MLPLAPRTAAFVALRPRSYCCGHARLIVAGATTLLCAAPALAQDPFIYPQKGQSSQQQQQDKGQCQAWAMKQSGVDPGQPAPPPPPPPSSGPQGHVLRGAGRGAAVGAVGGAIRGDACKGAAMRAAAVRLVRR